MNVYKKGYVFENQISIALRMMSFYVIRSYASKGVADLVALPPINKLNNRGLAIQAKNTKKGDYISTFERDHLNYLQQTSAGIVVLIYKDNHKVMVKVWESGEKISFGDFIEKTYGIKCDFGELLKDYRNNIRPIQLHPVPKDINNKFIAPFADYLDVLTPSKN